MLVYTNPSFGFSMVSICLCVWSCAIIFIMFQRNVYSLSTTLFPQLQPHRRSLDQSKPGVCTGRIVGRDHMWSIEVFIISRRFLEDSSGILTIPEDFQDWVLSGCSTSQMFSPGVSYSWGLETVPRTTHQDWYSGLDQDWLRSHTQDWLRTCIQDLIRTHSGLIFSTDSGLTQDSHSGLIQDWFRTHLQDWIRTHSGLIFRTGSGLTFRTGAGLIFRTGSGLTQDSHSELAQDSYWLFNFCFSISDVLDSSYLVKSYD